MSGSLENDFTMLKTRRNKEMILYRDYFYVMDYKSKEFQYWRCQQRKCKGRLRTVPLNNIDSIEELGFYDHTVSDEDKKKKLLECKIKNIAENTVYPTNKVYSVASINQSIMNIPIFSKKSIYKHIQNIRKRKNIETTPLSDCYNSLKTNRNESFCLYDSGSIDKNRIIIFTTEKNMIHLKNSNYWIADGTFKVVPKEYYQLYTIHGAVFNKVFPLVYVLMSDKLQKSYEQILQILKAKGNVDHPKNIIIDFEMAAYNAFKKSSQTSIHFCLFHFGQCIYRKIQKLGCSKEYETNEDFKLFVKCVTSLAFVPPNCVIKEFDKLQTKSKKFQNLNIESFMEYFKKNFIQNPKYPLESWNAHDRILNNTKLTSNSAEIFNRHFYSRFEQSHSGILTFIQKLKEHQSIMEQDILFQLCNPISEPYENKTKKKYENLKAIVQRYNLYYDTFYLEALARTYNWKLG